MIARDINPTTPPDQHRPSPTVITRRVNTPTGTLAPATNPILAPCQVLASRSTAIVPDLFKASVPDLINLDKTRFYTEFAQTYLQLSRSCINTPEALFFLHLSKIIPSSGRIKQEEG